MYEFVVDVDVIGSEKRTRVSSYLLAATSDTRDLRYVYEMSYL